MIRKFVHVGFPTQNKFKQSNVSEGKTSFV